MNPTYQDVVAARGRISEHVYRTPLEHAPWLGGDVYLKLECWQRTRSFKVRGAFNAIAQLPGDSPEVVTASAGNHGQAIALAARELGARATVFVPSTAPETKKARIRSFGATLDESSAHYDAAEAAAIDFAKRTGATFINGYSDPAVVAGQGTIGLELVEDMPTVRNIVLPVGGGGLSGGIGIVTKAYDPSIRVIGVQSDQTTAMYESFQAGRCVDTTIVPTLADGLAGATDERGYAIARSVLDDLVLVGEDAIARAIRTLYEKSGIVAEGSGAVSLAALETMSLNGPTVIIISGGNIDANKFAAIITAK